MKKIRTSHRNRKCRFPKCNQILSIYNHEPYCHVHLNRMNKTDSPVSSAAKI